MKRQRTWVQDISNPKPQTSYSYVTCHAQRACVDGMGWVDLLGEVLPTLGIFLERKSVGLFAAGMRTEAGEAECARTAAWSLLQRLGPVGTHSCKSWLARGSSCRDQKLEHESEEPNWRVPHGGGWDPTTSSLLLTLARVLPADGSVTELDKTLGNHCIIYYRPISVSPDPSQLRMPQASGRE